MSIITNRYKISYLGDHIHTLAMIKRNIDYSALEAMGNKRIAESILHAIDIEDTALQRLGISEYETNATPEIVKIHKKVAGEHWNKDLVPVSEINDAIQQDLFNEYIAENLNKQPGKQTLNSALEDLNRTLKEITDASSAKSKSSGSLERVGRMAGNALVRTITLKI